MYYIISTITNCRVSAAITINNGSDDSKIGGIVCDATEGSRTTVTGCLFDGTLASSGSSKKNAGTIIGLGTIIGVDPNVVIANCFDKSTDDRTFQNYNFGFIKQGENYITEIGNDAASYSIRTAHTITNKTDDVSLVFEGTTYSVSGITVPATGSGMQLADDKDVVYNIQSGVVYLKLVPPHGHTVSSAVAKYNSDADETPLTKEDDYFTLTFGNVDYNLYTAYQEAIEFTEGEGTAADPYLIYVPAQLKAMHEKINGSEGSSYYNKHYKLMADITCRSDFEPIGKDNETMVYHRFMGTFDGNGHTISGISLVRTTTDETSNKLGLFGYTQNATIKNVIVSNSTFTGYQDVGAIVAKGNGTTIENCHVTSDVRISTYDGFDTSTGASNYEIYFHGGIAGHFDSGHLLGCTSAAQFSTPNKYRHDYAYWGGIVGYGPTTNIKDCVYTGGPSANDLNNRLTAICGYTNSTTLTNNLFTDNSLKGSSTGGINEGINPDGAKPCYTRTDAKPANCGDVVTTYYFADGLPGTVGYSSGVSYDGTYYVAPATITLSNSASNESTLEEKDGYVGDVTISGRTLYKDGSWNTLSLPFSLSSLSGTVLEGADIRALSSSRFDESTGTLTMDFEAVSAIEAGKPYLVKWSKDESNLTDITFKDVTIAKNPDMTQTYSVYFKSNFSPVTLEANDKNKLYLGASNTLYWPSKDLTIGAFRAYFELDLTDGTKAARAFVLNFGDEATAITTTNFTDFTNEDGAWYDLQGRRLNGKPAVNGIYINNGQKIVIK